jgi:hypothetical protein
MMVEEIDGKNLLETALAHKNRIENYLRGLVDQEAKKNK